MIDITVTIDQRDYARYMAKLAKLEGRLRYDKVDRTLLAVASNIVMPVGKRLTPVGPKLKTQAGHPPKVLTAACTVGAKRATELFESAYDEHAHRLAKLYEKVGPV